MCRSSGHSAAGHRILPVALHGGRVLQLCHTQALVLVLWLVVILICEHYFIRTTILPYLEDVPMDSESAGPIAY